MQMSLRGAQQRQDTAFAIDSRDDVDGCQAQISLPRSKAAGNALYFGAAPSNDKDNRISSIPGVLEIETLYAN